MNTKTKARVMEQLGSPQGVDRELQSFQRTARILSSSHPRLINRYPKQWVAVHNGKVRASGRTFNSVMTQVDKKGLPRARIIVRYIDRNRRTMIL